MKLNASSAAPSMTSQRYHPALVTLHWLIALLILVTAFLALVPGGEDRRQAGLLIAGLPLISIHMILGITVLVLLAVRLVIRFRTPHPEWATAGSPVLDKIGVVTHWALYFFVFAITITGLVMALQTNRLSRIFQPATAGRDQFTFGQRPPGQVAPSGQPQPGQSPPGGQFQPGQFPRGGFEGGFRRGGAFLLREFHGLSWTALLVLILLHVAAALYHQFLRRDGLLSRMWFGRRAA
jgi:cytochrome b561